MQTLIYYNMKGGDFIYCSINSASIWGVEPYVIRVETDISQGMPCFNMVGLLSSEVRESKERVRTALRNSGENLPMQRITVNLSPADRKKAGSGFDLPIALGLLCSMGRMDMQLLEKCMVIGELGLDGEIKRVNGILPIVSMANEAGFKKCIVPKENLEESSIIQGIEIISFNNLSEVIRYFGDGNRDIDDNKVIVKTEDTYNKEEKIQCGDYKDIIGQESVKRSLLISACGWHNIMLIGSPGVGKSMLASRLPGIMPDMTDKEKMEVSNIHSICGLLSNNRLLSSRPFVQPYHTITASALVGGGSVPRPGQITIAHKGVLFLDELPEFGQNILDLLRQPLEEKKIRINRMSGNYVFPADCLVVTAMNPCKCGYYPDRSRCNCSEKDVKEYLGRISGPVIDRMDMSIEVPRVEMTENYTYEYMGEHSDNNFLSTEKMKSIVKKTAAIQMDRQSGIFNGRLNNRQVNKYCRLKKNESDFMREAYNSFGMSMRGYYKVIKVARTIADIGESDDIQIEHLSEALGYRVDFK